MSFEPFMWTTFCDDIRQEAGNKLSYMGVYGPNLIVPALPTTLLKLCCVFNVRVPASSPPNSLVFKLLRDDEVIFEANLTAEGGGTLMPEMPQSGPDPQAITINSIAKLVSFQVTQRATLKARAYVDGKELRGGGLELMSVGSQAAH